MLIEDLGEMEYRAAWKHQEDAHAAVLAGSEERLLLVQHPPVITLGRRPGVDQHLLTPSGQLQKLGVDVVQSDRGGDITFHGPGQLVVYPIVRLIDHALSVGGYVRKLQESVIATLRDFGLQAGRDEKAVGVWIEQSGTLSKICAIGVRIRRGISLHGLALNVTTDLSYFNLIVPCGLTDRSVTSMRTILGQNTPQIDAVKKSLTHHLKTALG